MSEQQKNGAQSDEKQAPAAIDRVGNIRDIFLETIKPLAGDLNSEEVLFFVEKSFELGLEALTLQGEAIRHGANLAQQQMIAQQQAYQAQMQKMQEEKAEKSTPQADTQAAQEPTQDSGPHGLYL